ncbi:MAG: WYL domain-containing protein [Candidatus Margulisiibacteriota bacterium]
MERHVLFRIHDIDRLLKRNRYPNCTTLRNYFIDHFGLTLSIRTILRDLDTMRHELGAPIAFNKEKNGYYYTDKNFSLPNIRLSQGEMIAVFLGTKLLQQYKNTPFAGQIEKAFAKIEMLLPDSVSLDLKNMGDCISFDVEQCYELDAKGAKTFALLTKAINARTSVEVSYYSIGRDTTSKRVLDPYHLRHTLGRWYLVAFCHKRKDVRTFAVDQIEEIKALKAPFNIQAGFSPAKFFASAWRLIEGGELTKVVVKLDKSIARWFEKRKQHPSQQTKKNKDGSLTLTFQVAGTDEIKRWIMSQGSMAVIIEPKELKESVRNEARMMLK